MSSRLQVAGVGMLSCGYRREAGMWAQRDLHG